jgi:transcriptional regulator with XRE-family HTH domain
MVNRAAIKLRREALSLTMDEAGRRAGWHARSKQRWYAVEGGARKHISAETLYLVARALGCSMDELMLPPKTKPPTSK